MRTTVDIDDNLLAIARVRASERGISLGAAISEMMRQGLGVPRARSGSGFPVFRPTPDAPVVTDALVARYRDDDPSSE